MEILKKKCDAHTHNSNSQMQCNPSNLSEVQSLIILGEVIGNCYSPNGRDSSKNVEIFKNENY